MVSSRYIRQLTGRSLKERPEVAGKYGKWQKRIDVAYNMESGRKINLTGEE